MLSEDELKRYGRQIIHDSVGEAGQNKIKGASVLVVGVGGLGSPASLYLAAAGVGRIGIIDFDRVDSSNLHRQILFSTRDEGCFKAEAAKRRLQDLNPLIQIETYQDRLGAHNAKKIFENYDYICDGADNFATRFLINDAAVFSKKILVSASILGFEGQLGVFNQPEGPCYRCLYPEPPPLGQVPSCAEAGVLGVLPGIMGVLQATAVINDILGLSAKDEFRLLLYDSLQMKTTSLEIQKNPECPICGGNPKIQSLQEFESKCSIIEKISAKNLFSELKNKKLQLIDVREASEREVCRIQGDQHLPLGQLQEQWLQLSQEVPVVVYCKSGGRSQQACEFLNQKGFYCRSLEGGILEWIAEVQPELKKH